MCCKSLNGGPPQLRRLLIAVVAGVLSTAAHAGELCVRCTGPDAAYRCTFDGPAPARGAAGALQLQCISEIAQARGHATCALDRNVSGPCDGAVHVLAAAGPPAAAPPAGMAAPAAAPPADAAAPPLPAKPAAARTVKELAERNAPDTTAAVNSAVEKSGSAIGNAARKTWGCVASFFKDC